MRRIQTTDSEATDLLRRHAERDPETIEQVRRILAEVQVAGDDAVREFTQTFDDCDLPDPWLDDEQWEHLAEQCPPEVEAALRANAERIHAFHARQVPKEDIHEASAGVILGRRPVAHESVACYVPGGRASYPSTVLMTVIPARLAGVPDIIVATPPRPDGSIDPAVAAAARIAGASRILRAGGAQAIAALAFGTETIPDVQAIVGPGNAYVTEAKRQVRDLVQLDAPAGPSELLVLALQGHDAPAQWIAADLVAQAEHDPDARVVLVTTDAALADAVEAFLPELIEVAPRRQIIEQAMQHAWTVIAPDRDAAIDFTNDYAPEHLEILSDDPQRDLQAIHHAGSIFLGPHAPVSVGDYGSGTNHVLPTMGQAHIRGGLSVSDFVKWITWQRLDAEGLAAIASDIITVAEAEGLHGHADAVRRRQ